MKILIKYRRFFQVLILLYIICIAISTNNVIAEQDYHTYTYDDTGPDIILKKLNRSFFNYVLNLPTCGQINEITEKTNAQVNEIAEKTNKSINTINNSINTINDNRLKIIKIGSSAFATLLAITLVTSSYCLRELLLLKNTLTENQNTLTENQEKALAKNRIINITVVAMMLLTMLLILITFTTKY